VFRLIEPARIGGRVHYESADGRKLLCSQSKVMRVIDGENMRVWFRTKRAVTCQSCTKALEVTVRKMMRGLTGDQLEDIAAHIGTFSMRNGIPR
jgi:hypothetical protein